MKSCNFKGQIAAIAEYPDQSGNIEKKMVSMLLFNIYSEAGSGFARHVCGTTKPKHQ
ncbi:hypothetical protein O9992_04005 [Vibrio lentus]|nr:hypothetical protein [Vibrio lentus]